MLSGFTQYLITANNPHVVLATSQLGSAQTVRPKKLTS
jgi:hypothetical protein